MTTLRTFFALPILCTSLIACGHDSSSRNTGGQRDDCISGGSATEVGVSEPVEEGQPLGRPQLPVGPDDALAQAACSLLGTVPTEIIAVADANSAGQVVVTPRQDTALSVRLPDAGVGYFTLEIPEWSITIATSLRYQESLVILDENCDIEPVQSVSWNGACDDSGLIDHRHLYHAWGSFTVRITGDANEPVHLSFMKLD
ncbi:MAG: hypothetical protein VYA30_02485 [Myxococcota bacterium]|nr:hypothetical protein [Myxococcota bacterium]